MLAPTFRIASWNIRKAIGGDGWRDPGRVLDVIGALGADIVVLQEGDYRFRGRAPLFSTAEVRMRTGLIAVDLDHDEPGLGWHGNVLMVSPALRVDAVRRLTLRGLEPRGAVVADLVVADRPVQVAAAHLALLPWDRRRQAEAMVAAMDPSPDGAVIALGDFNGWGLLPGSLSPFREAMREVVCGPSYPARRPLAPLDRIFHRGLVSPTRSGVWREAPAPVASDHLPIWADMVLG